MKTTKISAVITGSNELVHVDNKDSKEVEQLQVTK